MGRLSTDASSLLRKVVGLLTYLWTAQLKFNLSVFTPLSGHSLCAHGQKSCARSGGKDFHLGFTGVSKEKERTSIVSFL